MSKALVAKLLEGSAVHLLTTAGTLVLEVDDEGALSIRFLGEGELQGQLWPTGKRPSQRATE